MYLGSSTLIAGRETYMGQRFGSERKYWNVGMGTASDETPAAIAWYIASINAGRVPWGSFKFGHNLTITTVAGSNAITASASTPFRSSDVGASITGSGSSAGAFQASTVIASVTDATHATLSKTANSSGTWSGSAQPSITNSWAKVRDGAEDAWINYFCTQVSAGTGGKGPNFVTFHHEPNGDGVASEYLAMCQHIQTITSGYSPIVHIGGVLSAGYYQMSGGGGYNAADWMQPDSCDIFGLDIYNPWSPVNGKAWYTADQSFRLGGISECLAMDSSKPIALGELGCKTRPTAGQSAQWIQDGYDYCLASNVVCIDWFDSGVNAPDGPWLLDKDYQNNTEVPAERLIKYRDLLLQPTSKLIPLGGLPA
jgi:hypothetical protein